MNSTAVKQKVAILGGGPSGMTAAFYLTDPSLNEKYDVTVYQYGWRLGGKGACARGPVGQRVEEHGLHEFLGFYDNAFRMLRSLWPEWKRAPETRFPTWESAFTKQPMITFMQQVNKDGAPVWEPWNLEPMVWPGTPGDPEGITFDDFLPRLLTWLTHRHVEADIHKRAPLAHLHLQLARLLAKIPHPHPRKRHPLFHATVLKLLERAFEHVLPHTLVEDISRVGLLLRLGYAGAKGFLRDVMPYGVAGFDRINGLEFRQWLINHGASHGDAWSAPVKSVYDAAFAYNKGDANNPEKTGNAQIAAGVAMQAALLMVFGTRGAFLWKMNAGMGDTIFSPLYDVLKERGVKFEFFHRVEHIGVNGSIVDRIRLMKQVDLKKPYDPFIWVRDLPCWPAQPKWEYIENGDVIRQELLEQGVDLESWWCTRSWAREPNVVLERGRDFDLVVCAIPPAAMKPIAGELVAASDAWRSMLEKTVTIRTQGVQLWLKPTLAELGWQYQSTVSVSYTEPLDAWGEMSHLLPVEDWGDAQVVPQSIEYFCGALPEEPPDAPRGDATFPRRMKEQVKENARVWLSRYIAPIWPFATDREGTGLNLDLLVGGFDDQYFRANIDPSERYVLSVPGSMEYRLTADGSGFDNLFLAGDWIVTRVNSGAFEAAVESGCRCSHAICGVPETVFGLHNY